MIALFMWLRPRTWNGKFKLIFLPIEGEVGCETRASMLRNTLHERVCVGYTKLVVVLA